MFDKLKAMVSQKFRTFKRAYREVSDYDYTIHDNPDVPESWHGDVDDGLAPDVRLKFKEKDAKFSSALRENKALDSYCDEPGCFNEVKAPFYFCPEHRDVTSAFISAFVPTGFKTKEFKAQLEKQSTGLKEASSPVLEEREDGLKVFKGVNSYRKHPCAYEQEAYTGPERRKPYKAPDIEDFKKGVVFKKDGLTPEQEFLKGWNTDEEENIIKAIFEKYFGNELTPEEIDKLTIGEMALKMKMKFAGFLCHYPHCNEPVLKYSEYCLKHSTFTPLKDHGKF